MFIGEFTKEMNTTKETIRYYMDEHLLTPEMKDGKYFFTELEKNDFQNIKVLRDMGLPIRIIKQIKVNKKDCGTAKQWQANLVIIENELHLVEANLETLNIQKEALLLVKEKLTQML